MGRHHGDRDRDVREESRTETFYATGEFYPYQFRYLREIPYPDLPPVAEVADKVTQIVVQQGTEVAELTAMAPAAETAGWTNVSTVYDRMAADHTQIEDFGQRWLTERGFPAPSAPSIAPAEFTTPRASIDDQLRMHEQSFNELLEMRRHEQSSTVRGMELWAATTTAIHISMLRTLDRDVDLGRRQVSASLEMELSGPYVASDQTSLTERMYAEDEAYYKSIAPPPVVAVAPEPEIIEKEVIVEKPVDRIVEKQVIVEKPVTVERIVERKVYVDRPIQKVAGKRQTIRRVRRPAK